MCHISLYSLDHRLNKKMFNASLERLCTVSDLFLFSVGASQIQSLWCPQWSTRDCFTTSFPIQCHWIRAWPKVDKYLEQCLWSTCSFKDHALEKYRNWQHMADQLQCWQHHKAIFTPHYRMLEDQEKMMSMRSLTRPPSSIKPTLLKPQHQTPLFQCQCSMRSITCLTVGRTLEWK